MSPRVILLSLLLVVLSHAAPAAEPPTPPAELKRLEPFVGTWKVEKFVSKQAEWTPVEVQSAGEIATTRWIMDGWFIEDRKAPGAPPGPDHLGIWHYEPAEKVYHYTMFQTPGGNRTDLAVRWNDKTAAFEGTASLPNGITMRTISRFPNKDSKEWQAKATDAAGKIYLDITCTEIRVTPAQSPK